MSAPKRPTRLTDVTQHTRPLGVPDKEVGAPLEERAHGEQHALKRTNLTRGWSARAAATLRTSPSAVGLRDSLHARTRADVPHATCLTNCVNLRPYLSAACLHVEVAELREERGQ